MNLAAKTLARIENDARHRLDLAARERERLDIDSALLTLAYLIETQQWARARELRAEIKAQHGM